MRFAAIAVCVLVGLLVLGCDLRESSRIAAQTSPTSTPRAPFIFSVLPVTPPPTPTALELQASCDETTARMEPHGFALTIAPVAPRLEQPFTIRGIGTPLATYAIVIGIPNSDGVAVLGRIQAAPDGVLSSTFTVPASDRALCLTVVARPVSSASNQVLPDEPDNWYYVRPFLAR